MPNIPPRGVWGRLTATDVRPVAEAFGLLTTGNDWRTGEMMWAWQPSTETWEVVWARTPGNPATATAVYAPTQVTVDWVPSTPQIADSFRIRRPDGSLAGTVANTETTFVDANPRPVDGAYTVHGTLGGVEASSGTPTNVVDLTLHATGLTGTVVNSPGTATQTVDLSWTLPAQGAPDQWALYRGAALAATLTGTTTSWTDTTPNDGTVTTYELRPVLSSISVAGTTTDVNVPAIQPGSVTLAATTTPISNLRLTWTAPSGGVTGYEVEVSTNGTSWTGHTDDTTPADWATTTATGYMRVRALSAGGASAWVQRGPVAAINDVTPPGPATITSFKPESSYGRMVVRFKTPADADFAAYNIQHNVNGGGYTSKGWVTAAPNTAYAVEVVTGAAAGQVRGVRIQVRDAKLNVSTGSTVTYTLSTSPIVVAPSGSLSGTMRNGAWRNDGVRSSTEIATGWTSSGHNIGCYFYGTTIASALAGKTITSAYIEYWRENEGGFNAAIQPLFWTHNLTTRSGTPTLNSHGVSEASRLGTGVARTGTTSGYFYLPSAFYLALQAGTARGLAMYRGYRGSGDPDSYYGLMSIGGVTGGSPARQNGRLVFSHLG